MRHTKTTVAKRIDSLMRLRKRLRPLLAREDELVLAIKDAGGGESKGWIAKLVKMPWRVMVVRAHKQLRLYAK